MNRIKIQLLPGHILNAPCLLWVLLGFSISYMLFFIWPVFFSDQEAMQFFRYVPALDSIGFDLKQMLSYGQSWLIAQQTPYIGHNLYPPLATVLFAPLLFMNFATSYAIVTLSSVFSYTMITFAFPLWAGRKKYVSSLLMLVFITGLFSYGFQFELERGQFNVIAVFMCFLAIWTYHYYNRYRYLAYILFTISIQLKVFPLVFIVMLISNWRDWKNNFKRMLMLVMVNFGLFFVLGPHVFVDFVKAITAQTVDPYIWVGNNSIRSFVAFCSKIAYDNGWARVNTYAAQIALFASVFGCIFLIMLQAYRQNRKGINPLLLFACTIGSLLIPAVSNDYKLSILAAPVAILLTNNGFWERATSPRLQIIRIVLTVIFSAAYSSTLFSYTNKRRIQLQSAPLKVKRRTLRINLIA